MPDYPRPAATSPLIREALSHESNRRAIRILEHAVWEAREEGVRLLDAPDDLVLGLEWLGTLYLIEGKPARAVSPLKDALKMRRRRYGVDHPQVSSLIARLHDAYEEQGRPNNALPRLERKLADAVEARGDLARRATRARSKLYDAYWSAGRVEEAFGLYRALLTRCEQAYGPNARETRSVRQGLAWEYLDAELPEGVELLRRNVRAARAAKVEAPDLAFARSELAMVYLWYGRPNDAAQLLRASLDTLADRDDAQARIVRREVGRLSAEVDELREWQRS